MSAEPCAVCNLPIKASRIRAKGRLFHEECFQCSNCGVSLESFFFKDGKLYCDPCETELFAKKCDKCLLPIQTTLVNVRGKTYHTDCFSCHYCKSSIKGGFFYIGGNFVCDKCDSTGANSVNQLSASASSSSVLSSSSPSPQSTSPPNTPSIPRSSSQNTVINPLRPPPPTEYSSPSYGHSFVNIPATPTPAVASSPTTGVPTIQVQSAPELYHNASAPTTPPPPSSEKRSSNTFINLNGQTVELPEGANIVHIPTSTQPTNGGNNSPSAISSHNFIYIVNTPNTNTGASISLPQMFGNTLRLSGDVSPSGNGSPMISPTSSTGSLISSSSSGSLTAKNSTLPRASDGNPVIEKHVPIINGKTITELLKTQTFDDILNNVLNNKIKVHNEIKKSELEWGDVMAAGASGKVYKGKYKGRDVAIKVYSTDNLCFSREEFDREVSIMSLLDHECFTEFYGANTEKTNYLFHVTELIKEGCLRDILLNKEVELSYAQQISLALDVANAMKYLHSMGVIHRDLKSGNVLVTEDMRGKIIDFGTSRAIDLSKQMTLNLGTSCWMAPEVFRNEPYTEACDVYSFGIVLWEIYCRRDPYENVNSWSIPVMVTKGERPVIPNDCPSDYAKLIKACWVDKAKKRPSFKEIFSTLNKIYGSLTLNGKSKKKGLFN